ncbi:SH3 domain-containing protein [Lentinula detonsa]|uniref:SH3 domain-containing protein n=1 Tax=Lentinula detonsa TaxID=2804962 RepID=A0A9W8P788_9AGAR|nr:SH3 domain-containing protein [Lentinula detonsa]
MSSSTLSKYASSKTPGVDLYGGSSSRDFCNSFWGEEGEAGVNVLFARMRGAQRTMEGMKVFWKERAEIEEEYGRKMMELAERSVGKDEIGEMKNSLRTLGMETYKLGETHLGLARQIRRDNEERCGEMLKRLVEWRKVKGGMVEKKYKMKLAQESYVVKAQEKYYNDCVRIGMYTQQMKKQGEEGGGGGEGVSEGQKAKMKRIEETVGANEKDYEMFVKGVGEMIPGWEKEWKGYCDEAQDIEEERLDFMKDNLWAYANAVSTVCVADDESCENIRTVLDQLETEKEIIGFVQEYGTGSMIPNPPQFIPYSTSITKTNSARQAKFTRATNKNAPPYATNPPPSIPPTTTTTTTTTRTTPSAIERRSTLPPQPMNGNDAPVPPIPANISTMGTTGMSTTGNKILFYVEALYDYTATIPEEFNFQSGDIIAVTDIPDDGWWSGELLDEERREEGRNVFPSNFVRLF